MSAPAVQRELLTGGKQKKARRHQQPEPADSRASCCTRSIFPPLAAPGVVIRFQVLRVALKVDGQTMVLQRLTGQDQVLALPHDGADPTGFGLAAHSDEGEALAADAQVLFELLAAPVAAHCLHPLQVAGVQEGLGWPVAALGGDVLLPGVLVVAAGCSRWDVAAKEGVVGIVPPGALAGGVVLGQGDVTQPETQQGQGEEALVSGHHPGHMGTQAGQGQTGATPTCPTTYYCIM